MKNTELVDLLAVINALNDKPDASPQFSFTLIRNKKIIEAVVESLREASKSPAEFLEYEEKRITLCRRMAARDEHGQPLVQNQNFLIADDKMDEFNRQIAELQTKYRDALKAQEDHKGEVDKLMDQEAEKVDLVRIPLTLFPPHVTPRQMEALLPIVDPGE